MNSEVPAALAERPANRFLPEVGFPQGNCVPGVSQSVTYTDQAGKKLHVGSKGLLPLWSSEDGSEKSFLDSEYLRSFTDGISWLHQCSLGTCPVWKEQQNRLAFKGQPRPGGESLQMVAGQPAAIPAGSSGGSSSLNVPDHRAPRTPTFCCLCFLESIDGFSI